MRTYRFDPSTACEGTMEQSEAGPERVRRAALNNPAAPSRLIAQQPSYRLIKARQESEP